MATPMEMVAMALGQEGDRLVGLGRRAKTMSGLFGIRETITHVPEQFRVQLLDPLMRDHNRLFRATDDEDKDAGRSVITYDHAQHRTSRKFAAFDPNIDPSILASLDATMAAMSAHVAATEGADGDDNGFYDDQGEEAMQGAYGGDEPDGEQEREERQPPQDSLLLLNGVDSEGRTVCVRVVGMRYSFYVECPDGWMPNKMEALVESLCFRYSLPRGHIQWSQKRMRHIIGWEPDLKDMRRTREFNYCILGFGSATVMAWAAKAIQGNKLRANQLLNRVDLASLKVYESRVDPVHKALERMGGLKPCSWFNVKRWTIPEEYHTHAQIEVQALASDIHMLDDCDEMAPMWKASWDVECYSADGSFPRADHPLNTDHTICINTYFRQHRSDGTVSRVVQTSHHFGAVYVDREADPAKDKVPPSHDGSPQRWGVLDVEPAGEAAHGAHVEGTDKVYVMICDTELEAIEGWRDLIVLDVQPSVVEGYNTDQFDFGWVGVRAEVCANYGTRSRLFEAGVIIGEHTPMRRKDLDTAAKGSNTLNFIPMPGRILIDMYHIVKAEKRLESYTMDDVCKTLFPKDESLRKIDVPPAEIFAKYASGDLRERAVIVEYCARDCRLPMALEELMRTLTSIVEMSKIARTPLPLMLISGQQIKTWNQIVFAAHSMGYVMNIRENLGGNEDDETANWLSNLYGVGKGGGGVATEWLPGIIATANMYIGGGDASGFDDPASATRGKATRVGGAGRQQQAGGGGGDDSYEGATVLQPLSGYYDVPIVTLDYNSLYPSIMEANNLCPSTRVTDPRVIAALQRVCKEVKEPINEIRKADGMGNDGTGAFVMNRVFASNPNWRPGQFGNGVAYRMVSPAPGRTHIFVQHVQGVIPCVLTRLKQARRAVRDQQENHEKDTPQWINMETRQLGIKVSANCYDEDHEILTEHGFLNYGAVRKHFESHQRLGVACYVDSQLQYHDIDESKVIASTGTHRMVCFEPKGRTGVSLRCTDNHRIYARVGPTRKGGAWRGKKHQSQKDNAPPFTIQTAGALFDAGARDPSTVAQFTTVCEKGVAVDGTEPPFVAALGLRTEDEVDAFLELYGYWIGDGHLDTFSQAIVFSPVKTADSDYLADLFERLRLPILSKNERRPGAHGAYIYPRPTEIVQRIHYSAWPKPHCHYIYTPSWWRYFAEQYGHKYPGVSTLTIAIEAAKRDGHKLAARRPATVPVVSEAKMRAATRTGHTYRSPAFIASHNRKVNGVAERLCYGEHCESAGMWQPLDTGFSSRMRKHRLVYEGRCKRCMSANACKHHAAKKRRILEQYDALFAEGLGEEKTAPDAEDTKGAKWMWSWVWKLDRGQLRCLLRGLRMADGDSAERVGGNIYTASRRFADEIVRVALHAGYGAMIRPTCAKGSINGVNQRGVPIVASRQNWAVQYSDFVREARPKIHVATETRIETYEGTVWCVSVPVEPNLIIVRRIIQHKGVEVPSKSFIAMNSIYGALGAKQGRMPCVEVSESVTCIGRDMITATKIYVESHMARYVMSRMNLLSTGSSSDAMGAVCASNERRMQEAFQTGGLGPVRSVNASSPSQSGSTGLELAPSIPRNAQDEGETITALKSTVVDEKALEKARALAAAFAEAGMSPDAVNTATVVYGDSVSADTPLLVRRRRRRSGEVDYVTADRLASFASCGRARSLEWSSYGGDKQAIALGTADDGDGEIDVWTERGWTQIRRIIRHYTHKRMYRVQTPLGCVDVTEDHSLLDNHANKVKPGDVRVGSPLLHAPHHVGSLGAHLGPTLVPHIQNDPCDSTAFWKERDAEWAWLMGAFYVTATFETPGQHAPAAIVWHLPRESAHFRTRIVGALASTFGQISVSTAETETTTTTETTIHVSLDSGSLASPLREAFGCFYEGAGDGKRVPASIMRAPPSLVEAFLCGARQTAHKTADVPPAFAGMTVSILEHDDQEERFTVRGKLNAATLYYILRAHQGTVRIEHAHPQDAQESDIYVLAPSPKDGEDVEDTRICRIQVLERDSEAKGHYVYDLETESHHFGAGVGLLVVHNTDSVMIEFHGVPKTRAGVDLALHLGVAASDYITSKFPDQIILETEKAYWPYVLFRKKRYVGRLWSLNGKPPYIDAKGVEVKRRDNWTGMRNTYKKCLESMMTVADDGGSNRGIDAVKDIVLALVDDLIHDRVPLSDYKVSKSLKRDYSKCKSSPPHVVVRDKIRKRGGAEPLAGNRVYFVITVDHREKKVSARAEDPAYVAANPHLVRIDRLYYLNNLIKPFSALLEPCFLNPEVLFKPAAIEIAHQQTGQRSIMQYILASQQARSPTASSSPRLEEIGKDKDSDDDDDDDDDDDAFIEVDRARDERNANGKRPGSPLQSGTVRVVLPPRARSGQQPSAGSQLERRQSNVRYVPKGVQEQEAAKARKLKRNQPPPTSGPMTQYIMSRRL